MSLGNIRLRQQQQQAKAIAPKPGLPVATYKRRDVVTGDRIFEAADGGVIAVDWIAKSTPQAIPPLVAPSGVLGITGYAGQK